MRESILKIDAISFFADIEHKWLDWTVAFSRMDDVFIPKHWFSRSLVALHRPAVLGCRPRGVRHVVVQLSPASPPSLEILGSWVLEDF